MTNKLIQHFLKMLLVLLGALALFWFIERSPQDNQGVSLFSTLVAMELATGITVLLSSEIKTHLGRSARIFIGLFFITLAWGDSAWVVSYYILKLQSTLPQVSIFVECGYTLGFLFGVLGFLSSLSGGIAQLFQSRVILYSTLITTPICFKILILPLFGSVARENWSTFVLAELCSITCSFVLMNLGIYVLICTRNLVWSLFAAGMTSVVFGDWAMRAEKIIGISPKFGVYALFWAFGISVCIYPFFFHRDLFKKIEIYIPTSLLSQYKLASAALVFTSIFILSLTQYGSIDSLKTISVSCGIGAIAVALFGHILVGRIEHFSRLLGSLVGTQAGLNFVHDQSTEPLPKELADLYEAFFSKRIEELRTLEANRTSEKIAITRAKVAQEVAHDIRSPLAALNMVFQDLQEIEEGKRNLIKSAIVRITDIANYLLRSHRAGESTESGDKGSKVVLISALIENIVSEKRAQYRYHQLLSIDTENMLENHATFAECNPIDLVRVISNIIDNSVEAILPKSGRITLQIRNMLDYNTIAIRDNGRGMPPQILNQIGHRKYSYGKEDGNGLGLFQAKSYLNSIGGQIEFKSEIGLGTEVVLLLKKTPLPNWCANDVVIPEGSIVYVIDDDNSIHQVWSSKLSKLPNFNSIKVKHFWNLDTFLSEFRASPPSEGTLFMDFEFFGEEKSGLDVLSMLDGIRSYLVTSHFEDSRIQKRVLETNSQMIPKIIVPFINIRIGSKMSL